MASSSMPKAALFTISINGPRPFWASRRRRRTCGIYSPIGKKGKAIVPENDPPPAAVYARRQFRLFPYGQCGTIYHDYPRRDGIAAIGKNIRYKLSKTGMTAAHHLRTNTLRLSLPSLNDRPDDVLYLFSYFLQSFSHRQVSLPKI